MKLTQLQEARLYNQKINAEDAAEVILRYIAQEIHPIPEEYQTGDGSEEEALYFALMNEAKRKYRVHILFDEELIDNIIEKIAYGTTT